MIHELTEEQQEIVDYAKAFGGKSAAEHFSVTYGSVCYLLDKYMRIKGSRTSEDTGRFVEVRLPGPITAEAKTDDSSISFMIGTTTIRMSVSDFRKAFGL